MGALWGQRVQCGVKGCNGCIVGSKGALWGQRVQCGVKGCNGCIVGSKGAMSVKGSSDHRKYIQDTACMGK